MTIVTLKTEQTGEKVVRDRRTFFQAIEWQVRARPSVWEPPCDVFETETAYIVRLEVAGMDEREISVTLDGDLLLIGGSRADTPEHRAFHQMEIRFGEFSVAIVLPGPVQEASISGSYEDGFLLVKLPKAKA